MANVGMPEKVSGVRRKSQGSYGVRGFQEGQLFHFFGASGDLDGVRERTTIIQDEISNQLSEQMNRTMYHLTVVAAIFLPLGFITGLLSMNLISVPIPGSHSPWAFLVVCIFLAFVGGLAVLIFRRLKWM